MWLLISNSETVSEDNYCIQLWPVKETFIFLSVWSSSKYCHMTVIQIEGKCNIEKCGPWFGTKAKQHNSDVFCLPIKGVGSQGHFQQFSSHDSNWNTALKLSTVGKFHSHWDLKSLSKILKGTKTSHHQGQSCVYYTDMFWVLPLSASLNLIQLSVLNGVDKGKSLNIFLLKKLICNNECPYLISFRLRPIFGDPTQHMKTRHGFCLDATDSH